MRIYFAGDCDVFRIADRQWIIERTLKARENSELSLIDGAFTLTVGYWIGPIIFGKLENDDNFIMKAYRNPRFSKWKMIITDDDYETNAQKILRTSTFIIPMKRYKPY